jgi:hypothetical protein
MFRGATSFNSDISGCKLQLWLAFLEAPRFLTLPRCLERKGTFPMWDQCSKHSLERQPLTRTSGMLLVSYGQIAASVIYPRELCCLVVLGMFPTLVPWICFCSKLNHLTRTCAIGVVACQEPQRLHQLSLAPPAQMWMILILPPVHPAHSAPTA